MSRKMSTFKVLNQNKYSFYANAQKYKLYSVDSKTKCEKIIVKTRLFHLKSACSFEKDVILWRDFGQLRIFITISSTSICQQSGLLNLFIFSKISSVKIGQVANFS